MDGLVVRHGSPLDGKSVRPFFGIGYQVNHLSFVEFGANFDDKQGNRRASSQTGREKEVDHANVSEDRSA